MPWPFLQVEVIKKAYMQGEVEFEDGENGEDDGEDSNDHGEDGEDAGGKEGERERREGRRAEELPNQLLFISIMLHLLLSLRATLIIFLNISNIVKLQKILEEFLLRLL